MSIPGHPETDFYKKRAKRVYDEMLRGYVHSFSGRSERLSIVEFAINNSVHVSAQHTPLFVNGLRYSCMTTLLECNSWKIKGWKRWSKNRFVSCSSRVCANVVTHDTCADQVDIKKEGHLSNRNGAINESDNDNDARTFSISRDYTSEDEDTLLNEKK